MSNAYSISNTIEQGARYNGAHDTEGIAATALKAIGLTENATGSVTRVYVSDQAGGTGWGVDVPPGRAEEFARQLWKDARTRNVKIGSVAFPRPAERTVEDVEKEFEAFKKKVVTVAMEKAKEHDWCHVVKDALTEMGLKVPSGKTRVVVEFDFSEYGVDGSNMEAVKEHIRCELDAWDVANAVKSVEPIEA